MFIFLGQKNNLSAHFELRYISKKYHSFDPCQFFDQTFLYNRN